MLKLRGDYASAEPLYRRASDIIRKAVGENTPSYATSLNNLAIVYKATGKLDVAETLLRQTREIECRTMGESHPGYATTLSNLASLYTAMGRLDEAEPLYLQAIEIRRSARRDAPGLRRLPEQPR